MHSDDVKTFVAGLVKKGFVPTFENNAFEVAVVSPSHGLYAHGCEWLVFATYQGVPVAWADGTDPTPIVGPPGYELGRTSECITAEEASKRLIFIRTENAIDVFMDKETGKEVYVGRTRSE